MIFRFTLTMESGKGRAVHQVIGAHPSKSCTELADYMCKHEFICINQFYVFFDKEMDDKGPLILNCNLIGKVDEFIHRAPVGDEA